MILCPTSELSAVQVDPALVRNNDLYERIPGYPQPPLIQIPDTHDLSGFDCGEDLSRSWWTRAVVRSVLALSGLHRFARDIGPQLEPLLRRQNVRLLSLVAPQLSGTSALADDPQTADPYRRAAGLLIAARELRAEVMSGRFPADLSHGEAQEMGQYPNLFGTTVVVDDDGPRIAKTHACDHVAVICRQQFYRLQIGDSGVEQLATALEQIAARSRENPTLSPAIATCGETADQVRAFTELRRTPGNIVTLARLKETLPNPTRRVRILFLKLRDDPRHRVAVAVRKLVGSHGSNSLSEANAA